MIGSSPDPVKVANKVLVQDSTDWWGVVTVEREAVVHGQVGASPKWLEHESMENWEKLQKYDPFYHLELGGDFKYCFFVFITLKKIGEDYSSCSWLISGWMIQPPSR